MSGEWIPDSVVIQVRHRGAFASVPVSAEHLSNPLALTQVVHALINRCTENADRMARLSGVHDVE